MRKASSSRILCTGIQFGEGVFHLLFFVIRPMNAIYRQITAVPGLRQVNHFWGRDGILRVDRFILQRCCQIVFACAQRSQAGFSPMITQTADALYCSFDTGLPSTWIQLEFSKGFAVFLMFFYTLYGLVCHIGRARNPGRYADIELENICS